MKESVPAEVLDDLVQIVTHRIASLTAGVEGYADMLADTLHDREQRRLARHILEGVARINGVVDDLRYYTQSVEPVFIPVRVDTLVRGAIDIFGEDLYARVEMDPPESTGPKVLADPHLSRQVLFALLQNAVDATRAHGRIAIRVVAADRSAVEIRIWNEGERLPAEDAGRALAPFYTTKARNLGLGLTIARRMAEVQNGDVRFESSDQGTLVIFRLPRAVAQ